MKQSLKTVAAVMMIAGGATASAQDIHFSQFYENAMLRNPALTGIFSGDYKAVVNYRSQWAGLQTGGGAPFTTALASFEMRSVLNEENGDALSYGLTLSYDKAGSIDFTTLQIYPAINYNKSLEDERGTFLSVGFAGGYIRRSVNPGKMTFDNQYVNGLGYDPAAATGESYNYGDLNNWDLSAGVSLNSSLGDQNQVNYYLGAAAYHVARPQSAFNKGDYFVKMNMRWNASLGFQWRIDHQWSATVHAQHSYQKPYKETIFGGFAGWRNWNQIDAKSYFGLQLGCFYRVGDAIIPTARVDVNQLSFIASYDINNSTLQPSLSNGGGFEMSVVLKGAFAKKRDAQDQINCPRFDFIPSGWQQER